MTDTQFYAPHFSCLIQDILSKDITLVNLHNNIAKWTDIPLYTQLVENPSEMDDPQIHSL